MSEAAPALADAPGFLANPLRSTETMQPEHFSGDWDPQSSRNSFHVPVSPAPTGYLANPYWQTAEDSHRDFNEILSRDESTWQSECTRLPTPRALNERLCRNKRTDSEVPTGRGTLEDTDIKIYARPGAPASELPMSKGTTYVPKSRPIELLACIHTFSYRNLFDTRFASAGILQRYSLHDHHFYLVIRGIGPIYSPRDATGVQTVRFYDNAGARLPMCYPDTPKVDIVYRSVNDPEVPPQEGKVRAWIHMGGYRLEWDEAKQATKVTYVAHTNLQQSVPRCESLCPGFSHSMHWFSHALHTQTLVTCSCLNCRESRLGSVAPWRISGFHLTFSTSKSALCNSSRSTMQIPGETIFGVM